jgi:hypothetical protein
MRRVFIPPHAVSLLPSKILRTEQDYVTKVPAAFFSPNLKPLLKWLSLRYSGSTALSMSRSVVIVNKCRLHFANTL